MVGGTDGNVHDPVRAIYNYVRNYNRKPQPWVASASRIIRNVNRYKETIVGSIACGAGSIELRSLEPRRRRTRANPLGFFWCSALPSSKGTWEMQKTHNQNSLVC